MHLLKHKEVLLTCYNLQKCIEAIWSVNRAKIGQC